MHTIEKYWNIAFRDYKKQEGEFFCAQMPDPILSPNFFYGSCNQETINTKAYLNVIQEQKDPIKEYRGFQLRNKFYLCDLDISNHYTKNLNFVVRSMQEERDNEVHWGLMANSFGKDYLFLKKLEEFLPTLNANYYIGTLYNDDQEAVASINIGIAGECAVLLSGMVHSKFRDQKLSREIQNLVHLVCFDKGVKKAFYWTMSEKLLSYANSIKTYLIYTKIPSSLIKNCHP